MSHPCEPNSIPTQGFDYRVWAPKPGTVELLVDGVRLPMCRDDWSWWSPIELPEEYRHGEHDYGFLTDGAGPYPDPTSRRQPDGVHGLSRTYDPDTFVWTDQDWTGRQLAGGVIYELHVGTFTPAGTLDSAIDQLDHLVRLGIDFVELMPVNAFSGPHGWGYDGVDWYAVHEPYGGPAAYQRFVNACHNRGLAVIQDVVYNHFGASGNYLPRFGPYLNPAIQTPWGDAVNLDGEGSDQMRSHIIANALMWLRAYHCDGLRLDAVHALIDSRALTILEELSIEVDALSAHLGQPCTLIAESDLNNPRVITPREAGGFGLTAQWSDDFHHALLANLTGLEDGYYSDFTSLAALGKVVESGFFHDGSLSSFRGRRHGRRLDTPNTPTWRLVVCSDNHDQIGNRARGEQLSSFVSQRQLGLAAMLTLLNGCTPMLFMGQEWGSTTPFTFFTSYPEPELAEAVRIGRWEEFAKAGWDPEEPIPDPQDEQTFLGAKLDWAQPELQPHCDLFGFHQALIELRRTWPDLTDPRFDASSARFESTEHWFVIERGQRMSVAINFEEIPCEIPFEAPHEILLSLGYAELDDQMLYLGGHSGAVLLQTGENNPDSAGQ